MLFKARWKEARVNNRAPGPSESSPLLVEQATPPSVEDAERKEYAGFDQLLLFVSMAIKCGGELILGANARASGAVYIVGSLVLALSAAANPCAGVLALEFANVDKRGELFGALGVIEAISTTVVGPVIYTYIFVATLDWYPAFMFLVASATGAVGAVLVALVRLP